MLRQPVFQGLLQHALLQPGAQRQQRLLRLRFGQCLGGLGQGQRASLEPVDCFPINSIQRNYILG
jgi:hypothetical protein